jgi:hypothetical protein
LASNQGVAGSNPAGRTKHKRYNSVSNMKKRKTKRLNKSLLFVIVIALILMAISAGYYIERSNKVDCSDIQTQRIEAAKKTGIQIGGTAVELSGQCK